MKIVFQHDHPLPVTTYGGTERIMFWHMKELVRQGHQVVLIGHPDSLVEGFGLTHIRMKRREYNNWKHLVPKDADIIHLQYIKLKRHCPSARALRPLPQQRCELHQFER